MSKSRIITRSQTRYMTNSPEIIIVDKYKDKPLNKVGKRKALNVNSANILIPIKEKNNAKVNTANSKEKRGSSQQLKKKFIQSINY